MIKKEKIYYSASEVSEILGISLSTAYRIIRQLNNELRVKNYIVISGRISKAYFEDKYYGSEMRGVSSFESTKR